jgi:UDP-N-acetylglucosamine/UDP-N-acetylgalactosamine diphosphorylase
MFTIGEVCNLLGIRQHVLRYWEKEIPFIAAKKNIAGRRIYSRRDIQILFRLRYLLHQRGYTLKGAKAKIWEEIQQRDPNLTSRFAEIRGDLITLLHKIKGDTEGRMKVDPLMEEFEREGQDHLFFDWDSRSESMKRRLLKDLETLDLEVFSLVKEVLDQKKKESPQFTPAPYIGLDDPRRDAKALELGKSLIAGSKTAFLTVAGGQGSRLGFEGPKGMFSISPVRKASLFQIFSEKLLAAVRKYGTVIPWYIMTSPQNHETTVDFFKDNSFFGLEEDHVFFFPQGVLPTFDVEGKMLMGPDGGLLTNPDGHGGMIRALKKNGLFADMKRRGVEELFYFQVDNPLVEVPDPLFLGVHKAEGSLVSTKVIRKAYPEEKLGVIGLIDGRMGIIEYSDLDEKSMHSRNSNGELQYLQGSIAIHIFNVDFISRENLSLPYHVARKKVKTLIHRGEKTEVVEKDGVKLEMFIFDTIPIADKSIFYETSRDEEFAPLKNREGVDSIDTCIAGQIAKSAGMLERAGVRVPFDEKGIPLYKIEISPLFALDIESLQKKLEAENTEKITGDSLFE